MLLNEGWFDWDEGPCVLVAYCSCWTERPYISTLLLGMKEFVFLLLYHVNDYNINARFLKTNNLCIENWNIMMGLRKILP